MTETLVTPAGVPSSTDQDRRARYLAQDTNLITYRVRLPAPAPPELRVTLQFGQEDAGVWAHIEEIDISAEGADFDKALRNVVSAASEWLTYMRDEAPELAADLAAQARYVALLDAPPFSWFKTIRLAE
jgi:hypothetical protein